MNIRKFLPHTTLIIYQTIDTIGLATRTRVIIIKALEGDTIRKIILVQKYPSLVQKKACLIIPLVCILNKLYASEELQCSQEFNSWLLLY